MMVSWQPTGCGRYFARTEPSYADQNYGTGNNCGRPSVNVHLFINGYVHGTHWAYQHEVYIKSLYFNAAFTHLKIYSTLGPGADLYCMLIMFWPGFHRLTPIKSIRAQRDFVSQLNISVSPIRSSSIRIPTLLSTYTDPQFVYPFDDYESQNTFVAFTSPDGSLSNATFLPILNVAAVDASETFIPSFPYFSPVPNASVMLNGVQTDTEYVFMLTIRCNPLAKIFALIVFTVNWGLVICVMWVTLAAWASQDKKVGDWAVTLPVAIILTIPGLQALFVGTPPLGEFPPWNFFSFVMTDCVHSRIGILVDEDVMSGEYVDNQLICLCL